MKIDEVISKCVYLNRLQTEVCQRQEFSALCKLFTKRSQNSARRVKRPARVENSHVINEQDIAFLPREGHRLLLQHLQALMHHLAGQRRAIAERHRLRRVVPAVLPPSVRRHHAVEPHLPPPRLVHFDGGYRPHHRLHHPVLFRRPLQLHPQPRRPVPAPTVIRRKEAGGFGKKWFNISHLCSATPLSVVRKVDCHPRPIGEDGSSPAPRTRTYTRPSRSSFPTKSGCFSFILSYTRWLRAIGVSPPLAGGTSQ